MEVRRRPTAVVIADEVRDPQTPEVRTTVNGEQRQRGTPAGVAHGMKPPRYLEPGDVVEMGVTGLGVQKSSVVDR
ncbi:MAG TPA: fumarylacetoacetate hydrolase family protein [Methylomirabilota bacterium]|nr:fumarylacetoacetate hydrolase family protein [Methylomirabilota bacterium]